jgi:hypothetical protein
VAAIAWQEYLGNGEDVVFKMEVGGLNPRNLAPRFNLILIIKSSRDLAS